ncbi:MAG: PQQ-dependent sugar dehydrogenase [Holophagales bacterium]|nr:PQQ-dependent sugar dehydrogenase [Holophagales bacterium]
MARTQPVVPSGFVDGLVVSVPGPTSIAFTPDGRLLVTRQSENLRVVTAAGRCWRLRPSRSPPRRSAPIQSVASSGVAVDPDFATNRSVFLFYTRNATGSCATGIGRARNRAPLPSPPTRAMIDPGDGVVLVDGIRSFGGNHNAGDLRFRARRVPLRLDGGTAERTGAGDRAAARTTPRAASSSSAGRSCGSRATGGFPHEPVRGAGTARCNPDGRYDSEQPLPGDVRMGIPESFRFATDRNAAGTRIFVNDVSGPNVREGVDERWRPGSTTAGTAARGRASTVRRAGAARPRGGMRDPLFG